MGVCVDVDMRTTMTTSMGMSGCACVGMWVYVYKRDCMFISYAPDLAFVLYFVCMYWCVYVWR